MNSNISWKPLVVFIILTSQFQKMYNITTKILVTFGFKIVILLLAIARLNKNVISAYKPDLQLCQQMKLL